MRITWEPNGEHPTRWDSNCVRRNDNGPMWFGRIQVACEAFLLEVHKNAEGPSCHWEHCATLAEAKRRGAEVLRALCGGPALTAGTVWCGVTPRGRVMAETARATVADAWFQVVGPSFSRQMEAQLQGYTVRKFRIEEVR